MENMKSHYLVLHTLREKMVLQLKCCSTMVSCILIPILLNGCANTNEIVHEEVAPISHDSKWDRAKSFQIEDYHLIIGVINDDKNLYVRVATTDYGLQEIITTSGCTIWVDADGTKTKIYGIHYPSRKLTEIADKSTSPPGPNRSNEKKDGAQLHQASEDLDIVLNGGDERTRITVSEALSLGLEADIKITRSYLLYDLKIPYTEIIAYHRSQISNIPQSIAIAFEIEGVTLVKDTKPEIAGSEHDNQRGQGRMGGGKRGGGGMRGGDKPERTEKTEDYGPAAKGTLEEWFIIELL